MIQKEELQKLAKKIQLALKAEELAYYLTELKNLEKILIGFKKVEIPKKIKPMERIDLGSLTLKDLEKLQKKFSSQKISKKTLQNNSEITKDGFVIFRKIS